MTDPWECDRLVMHNDYIKMTVQVYNSPADSLIINLIYLAGKLVIAATLNSIAFILFILRLLLHDQDINTRELYELINWNTA